MCTHTHTYYSYPRWSAPGGAVDSTRSARRTRARVCWRPRVGRRRWLGRRDFATATPDDFIKRFCTPTSMYRQKPDREDVQGVRTLRLPRKSRPDGWGTCANGTRVRDAPLSSRHCTRQRRSENRILKRFRKKKKIPYTCNTYCLSMCVYVCECVYVLGARNYIVRASNKK